MIIDELNKKRRHSEFKNSLVGRGSNCFVPKYTYVSKPVFCWNFRKLKVWMYRKRRWCNYWICSMHQRSTKNNFLNTHWNSSSPKSKYSSYSFEIEIVKIIYRIIEMMLSNYLSKWLFLISIDGLNHFISNVPKWLLL